MKDGFMTKKYRKRQKISENFLIDTTLKENIYLLGLLWADGYLNPIHKSISYSCKNDDFHYVKNIFKNFGVKHFYTNYGKKNNINRKPQKFINVCGKKHFDFLLENDYKIKSGTSAYKILSKIPEDLQYYWWRGYFDGDGCAHIDKRTRKTITVSLTSCIGQDWSFVIDLFNRLIIQKFQIIKSIDKRNHKWSRINIAKSNEVYKFFNYIYPTKKYDGLGFKRKFNKLIKIEKIFGHIRTNKYEGVILDKRDNKWDVRYKSNGKQIYIGRFGNQEDGYKARQFFIDYHKADKSDALLK